MTIAIDTDKAIQALTKAGFKKEQARVMIEQLLPANDDLVTKDYLTTELARLEMRLTTKLYGGQVAAVVAVIGALRLFGVI